jgi:hypothetical protein
MFHTKQVAVNNENLSSYLSTIYPDDHYRQEQKRWFEDAVQFIDPKSFQITIKKYKKLSGDRYQVEIIQSYQKKHKQYVLQYPVYVQKTKQGWKDADTFENEVHRGSLTVKYSDLVLKTQAKRSLAVLSMTSHVLNRKWNWHPKQIEAKLYQNPEIFRQSVKLSLPSWAGGWNEAKQSIKLVVGKTDISSLNHGLAHEYTHQLLSDMTNDNASYWLQEGAAMYYEAFFSKEKPNIERDFQPYSIRELENMNLEQLKDQDAYQYYLSCYIQFHRLIDKFGEKKIASVLQQLHQFPYIDADSAQKQRLTNQRTEKVLLEHSFL